MGFLDYIQEVEGRDIGSGGRLLRMMRPVVNILLGDFSDRERDELAFYPERYSNSDQCVFWCVSGKQREGDTILDTPGDVERYGIKAREAFGQYAKSGSLLREMMQKYADEVFNRTTAAGMVFWHAGSIRINFLVKADEAVAGMMKALVPIADEVFEPYYNGVRQKDIYLFADQRAYTEHAQERRASNYLTLTETDQLMGGEKGREKPQLAYFLSNFDSRGALRPNYEKERALAFGMLLLLKNAVPDGSSYHAYKDSDFGASIASVAMYHHQEKPGMFSSLGYLSLESNELLARLAAYKAVFESMQTVRKRSDEELQEALDLKEWDTILKKAGVRLNFSETDWRSIPRSQKILESGLIGKINGDCIEQLYGRNLEHFLILNCAGKDEGERAQQWIRELEKKIADFGRREAMSAFETAEVLSRVQELLSEKKESCKERLRADRDSLHKWESIRCNNLSREKLPVTKESRTLYIQAQEYLNKKTAVMNSERKIRLCEKMEEALQGLLGRFRNYQKLITEAGTDLEKKICSITEETSQDKNLQVINSDVYYSSVAEEILEYSSGYRDMCAEIFSIVFGGEITQSISADIYGRVYEFCDREIIRSIGFKREFMAEIFVRLKGYKPVSSDELKNADQIADYVLQIIDRDCKYHMFKSIYNPPATHEEMCFLLDAGSDFARANEDASDAVAVEQIRSKKLKLFCETGCERLEVLFLSGNIRLQELYQFDSYKASYENILQRGCETDAAV